MKVRQGRGRKRKEMPLRKAKKRKVHLHANRSCYHFTDKSRQARTAVRENPRRESNQGYREHFSSL